MVCWLADAQLLSSVAASQHTSAWSCCSDTGRLVEGEAEDIAPGRAGGDGWWGSRKRTLEQIHHGLGARCMFFWFYLQIKK